MQSELNFLGPPSQDWICLDGTEHLKSEKICEQPFTLESNLKTNVRLLQLTTTKKKEGRGARLFSQWFWMLSSQLVTGIFY